MTLSLSFTALKQSMILRSEYCTISAFNNGDHKAISSIAFISTIAVRRSEIYECLCSTVRSGLFNAAMATFSSSRMIPSLVCKITSKYSLIF